MLSAIRASSDVLQDEAGRAEGICSLHITKYTSIYVGMVTGCSCCTQCLFDHALPSPHGRHLRGRLPSAGSSWRSCNLSRRSSHSHSRRRSNRRCSQSSSSNSSSKRHNSQPHAAGCTCCMCPGTRSISAVACVLYGCTIPQNLLCSNLPSALLLAAHASNITVGCCC
jgi:hypothetical protein